MRSPTKAHMDPSRVASVSYPHSIRLSQSDVNLYDLWYIMLYVDHMRVCIPDMCYVMTQ